MTNSHTQIYRRREDNLMLILINTIKSGPYLANPPKLENWSVTCYGDSLTAF